MTSSRCLFSLEQECQTTVEATDGEAQISETLRRFLKIFGDLAPSLPGEGGLFNAYGRVYVDINHHLEFSALECDSPYVLAQMVDTQYGLATKATAELERRGGRSAKGGGVKLLLVNNNHNGLLRPETAFWGTHENYLIDGPAQDLADLTLPFLVTRLYGGAGGVLFPTAEFLAGTRPLAMELATGGHTTGNRAIYSTCREEHHMGPRPKGRRLHLILGDGHRSQFNLALQFGATALALKAIQSDRELGAQLGKVTLRRRGEGWVGTLQRLNKLANPGEPPRVDPSVIEVQRIYLDAAGRWVASMSDPQEWMAQILEDWELTLDAYERADRSWLAPRLDAFTKYELYSAYLEDRGSSWAELVDDIEALSTLGLLDHDYHSISEPVSAFSDLEQRGLLSQRVGDRIEPGSEEEPYVPAVGTRARARARFIKEHSGRTDLIMSWDRVFELPPNERVRTLFDPFAEAYAG